MKSKYLIIIGLALVILILAQFVLMYFMQPKTAYVSIMKVYESFEYKQELEGELTEIQQRRQGVLDSLLLELQEQSKDIGKGSNRKELERYRRGQESYRQMQGKFEQENQDLIMRYQKKALERLSQYIRSYGADESYDYILGADGGGSVMYAATKYDITEDVIRYVNDRYSSKPNKKSDEK